MKFSFPYYFLIFLTFWTCQQAPTLSELQEKIHQLNRQLEKNYNNGSLRKIATHYTKDAWLISARGHKRNGRKAINNYWIDIKQPIRWEITNINITKTEAELYETSEWQLLKNKPPHWKDLNLDLSDDKKLLYQLGRSTLEYERDDATYHARHFNFIIIWKQQPDGNYQILLDTFAED